MKSESKVVEVMMIVSFIVAVICGYLLFNQPCVYGAEPRIEDQGDTPMCGVYAVCNAIEYQMQLEGIETPEDGFDKDWLWDKCGEREDLSDGIDISTALDVACEEGLCPVGGTDEEKYKISTYSAIDYRGFNDALTRGHVVIVGTTLDRENWKDGILMVDENVVTEGHATYLIDFDEINEINGVRDYYIGVNSWGDKWGFEGKYYMRYNFAPFVLWAYVFEVK